MSKRVASSSHAQTPEVAMASSTKTRGSGRGKAIAKPTITGTHTKNDVQEAKYSSKRSSELPKKATSHLNKKTKLEAELRWLHADNTKYQDGCALAKRARPAKYELTDADKEALKEEDNQSSYEDNDSSTSSESDSDDES